jgi:hypothetical protein
MTEARKIDAVLAETHALLSGQSWRVEQGGYFQGSSVRVLLDPCGADDGQRWHLPVTIFPLIGTPADLEGVALIAEPSQESTAVLFGRLNRRGQIIFRDVDAGSYALEVRSAPNMEAQPAPDAAPFAALVTLPPVRTTLGGATGETVPWERAFRNADGSLRALLHRLADGSVRASVEVSDRRWDNAVLKLTWSTASGGQRSEQQRLCAILVWREAVSACTAEVEIGPVLDDVELSLPECPGPINSLVGESPATLANSIARAAASESRDAWRRLRDDAAVDPHVRESIRQAVNQRDLRLSQSGVSGAEHRRPDWLAQPFVARLLSRLIPLTLPRAVAAATEQATPLEGSPPGVHVELSYARAPSPRQLELTIVVNDYDSLGLDRRRAVCLGIQSDPLPHPELPWADWLRTPERSWVGALDPDEGYVTVPVMGAAELDPEQALAVDAWAESMIRLAVPMQLPVDVPNDS